MTDTDYDRFMDAVSSQFEQHLQRLFPDDYGLQRIAWDAWDDFRRTKKYDGPVVLGQPDTPMRDRYGRPIQAAQLKQLDFGGDPMPQDIFDLVEMLPYGDDEETEK